MKLSRNIILLLGLLISLGSWADGLPDGWSYTPLQHDWRAREMLDGTVYSHDGLRVGQVNDVILSADGTLKSIIVEQREGRHWRYFQVPWRHARFSPAVRAVTIEISRDEADQAPVKGEPDFVQADEYEVSDLLGVSVGVSDMKAYGRVDDLLFDADGSQLTAVVVKASGSGRKHYAVPADISEIHSAGQLNLPYSRKALNELGRFVEI